MRRRHVLGLLRVCRIACGAGALAVGLWPLTVGAQAADLVFAGHAEAFGTRATLTIPKAPVADTLVDVSAPSTSADLSSFGSAAGFAAFPSPGTAVLSLPSSFIGLLEGGAAGLPPMDLPSVPDYPFFVQADSFTPDATVGQGPYEISAHAHPEDAGGTASAGLQMDAAGSVVRLTTESSVIRSGDTATATASVVVDGLTVGPLSLGTVRSTATVTLTAGGIPETATTLEIEGARIAGAPVTITADGITFAGNKLPVPIGGTLADILEGAGIKFDFGTPVQDDQSATSPGLTITRQVETPGLGEGTGTMVLNLGYVSASIAPPPPPRTPVAEPPAASDGGVDAGPTLPPLGSAVAPDLGGPVATPGEAVSPSAPSEGSSSPALPDDTLLTGLSEALDLQSIYLATALGGFATIGLGSVIRLLGVRPS